MTWTTTPYGFKEAIYKGYTITVGFMNAVCVCVCGDEIVFDSVDDAKDFIDGMEE